MGERCVENSPGDLAGVGNRHAARGAERTEVDLVPECLRSLDGRCDMGAGMAFDERFDGELQQQHAIEL